MAQLFEWQQIFDGTQSQIDAVEQRQVHTTFCGFVVRVLREQLGDTKYYDDIDFNSASAYCVYPSHEVPETDATRFILSHGSRKRRSPEVHVRRTIEDHELGAQRLVHTTTYTFDGSYVRRKDDDDAMRCDPQKRQQRSLDFAQLDLSVPDDQLFADATSLFANLVAQECKNQDLARDMGVANQPIGMTELRGLMDVIRQARFIG